MRAHNWNVELAVQSTLPGFTEAPRSSGPPAIVSILILSAIFKHVIFGNTHNVSLFLTKILQPSLSSSSVQGLRHRNVGLQPHMHPLLNTRFYEARRSTSLVQPRGVVGWGYYLLSGPFRYAWITFSGIVK